MNRRSFMAVSAGAVALFAAGGAGGCKKTASPAAVDLPTAPAVPVKAPSAANRPLLSEPADVTKMTGEFQNRINKAQEKQAKSGAQALGGGQ